MYNFYPIIVVEGGEILHNPFASSHQEIIACCVDFTNPKHKNYMLVTYKPKSYRLDDIDNYDFVIEQNAIPDWFDTKTEKKAKENLKTIIRNMIIPNGRKKLVLNQAIILSNGAKIDKAKNVIIFGMYDDSMIHHLNENSKVSLMANDTKIQRIDSSIINEMHGNAKIENLCDNSKVRRMYGRTQIETMKGNSMIDMMREKSFVEKMHDNSLAFMVKHLAVVDEMHDNSAIDQMWDWSFVGTMYDNSNINYMDDDAKVRIMLGNSSVNEMYGNAVVERLLQNSVVKKVHETAKILQKRLDDSKKD